LRQQQGEVAPEILVPYEDSREGISELVPEYPEVRFLPHSGCRSFAELRAAGVAHAQGDVIALTEDHCCPAPDWCSKILEAHASSHAAVGGAVDKGFAPGRLRDGVMNWAVYLCDFSRYANPVAEGSADFLTDCNVSYKRNVLDSIASVWSKEFHETSVHWSLAARGESLRLTPAIVVTQQRSLSPDFALQERFEFGRLFASTRVAAVSAWKRLLYATFSFLLPVLLTARIAGNVLQKRRYIQEFFSALPVVFLLVMVWSCGEFWGYLTGKAGKQS
jgi:hypothetical protein